MSPCKKLESYDTPLCHFSNGGNKNNTNKKRKIPKIVAYGCFDETVCTAPLGPKYSKPSLTRQWSSLKLSVMVVDNKTTRQLGRIRGIPKTQRVLGSTNK